MQKNTDYAKTATILSAFCLIALAIFGVLTLTGFNNIEENMSEVPSAEDIADLIVIPEVVIPEVVIPEIVQPEYPDFGTIPGDCSNELKEKAEADAIAEVDLDDLMDEIEDNTLNFDEFVKEPTLDESETSVDIDELGYCNYWKKEIGDEEDDKVVTVIMEFDYSYEDTLSDDGIKNTIIVTATVTYDEGDFNDVDVDLVY